jgi:hypothetical protein
MVPSHAVAQQEARIPNCETYPVIGLNTDGGSARVVACSRMAAEVPKLQKAVEKINAALSSTNADRQQLQAVQALLTQINTTVQRLPQRLAKTFASSLADRLVPEGEESTQAQVLRELARLRLDFDDWREAQERSTTGVDGARRLETAYNAQLGEAVASFDFKLAQKMLAQLNRMEDKLDTVGRDVQELVKPSETAVLLPLERADAESQWARFLDLHGASRCPRLHGRLAPLLQNAEEFEHSGRPQAALELLAALRAGASVAAEELFRADLQADTDRVYFQAMLGQLDASPQKMQQRLDIADKDLKQSEKDQQSEAVGISDDYEGRVKARSKGIAQLRREIAALVALMQTEVANGTRPARGDYRDQSLAVLREALAESQRELEALRHRFHELQGSELWPLSPNSRFTKEIEVRIKRRDRLQLALGKLRTTRDAALSLAEAGDYGQAAHELQRGMMAAHSLERGVPVAELPERLLAARGRPKVACY